MWFLLLFVLVDLFLCWFALCSVVFVTCVLSFFVLFVRLLVFILLLLFW